MKTTQAPSWDRSVPVVPGLYWRTVCTSISSWHTNLLCISIEHRLDGSKLIRLTDVTPAFVRKQPSRPKTEARVAAEHNNHQSEYFLGPIEVPVAPEVEFSSPMDRVPPQPGLYYNHVYGSDGSGWHSRLISASVNRATGFEDESWEICLPEFDIQTCCDCRNAGYTLALKLIPPSKLPNGKALVVPITKP